MGNYKISERAKDDLFRIWRFGLMKFGRFQADKYAKNLFHHFEIIAENPSAFPIMEENSGYRKCVCGSDSIFYRVNEKQVEIVAGIGRQDIDEIFT